MDEIKKSGFDCPVYGVVIPKEYKSVKDKDGIVRIYAPKGTEVPEELKPYVDGEYEE